MRRESRPQPRNQTPSFRATALLAAGALVITGMLSFVPTAQATSGFNSVPTFTGGRSAISPTHITGLLSGAKDPGDFDESTDVTESKVEFVETEVPANYTAQGAVTEDVGDAQQAEVVATPDVGDEGLDHVARVDLPSDIVLIGVTWDPGVNDPAEVSLRYLQAGAWSSWEELEFENAREESTPSRAGTEPYTLTNAEAVEVVARTESGAYIPDLSLTVIDARALAPVENDLENVAHEPREESADTGILEESDEDLEEVTVEDEPTSDPGGIPADEDLDGGVVEDRLLDLEGATEVDNVSFNHGLAPGFSPGILPGALNAAGTQYDTGFEGLVINTRKGWGADESLMRWTPQRSQVNGAVIHHTAGNNNYTQAQVAGQVRIIYHYHAVTLGWGDIGYNLIVDRYGGVWEGRAGGLTQATQGAHAYGSNGQTFGISVIGDYTFSAPPAVALDALAKATAWKLSVHGITSAYGQITVPGENLAGWRVGTVSAHRDVGYTSCPGNAFYARMTSVRASVENYLQKTSQYSGRITRLSGEDRFATNLAVNSATSKPGTAVFVASGYSYADALTVGPAVSLTGGSLYLTRKNAMTGAALQAIANQRPSAIYVIGGTEVVSTDVEAQLRVATGKQVTRIAGENRFRTSEAVFTHFYRNQPNSRVFLATGYGYADALSAAAAAGTLNAPVLLVRSASSGLSASTVQALNRSATPKQVLGVGGASVIPNETLNAVSSQINRSSTQRLAGVNRFQTNAAVNDYLQSQTGTQPRGVWVATGWNFADALSAAVPAGAASERLVLSSRDCLPRPIVSTWLNGLGSTVQDVNLVGGTSVLSSNVAQLREC